VPFLSLSEEQAHSQGRKLAKTIKLLNHPVSRPSRSPIITCVSCLTNCQPSRPRPTIQDVKYREFSISNIVATCDVKFPIRLESLAANHQMFSTYEPELFPGLIYRMKSPKLVILIFVRYARSPALTWASVCSAAPPSEQQMCWRHLCSTHMSPPRVPFLRLAASYRRQRKACHHWSKKTRAHVRGL
jgi:hypothetical protein